MLNFRRNLLASELAGRLNAEVSRHYEGGPPPDSYPKLNGAVTQGTVQAFLDAIAAVRCGGTGQDCNECCREFASQFYQKERETIAELLLYAMSGGEA